jgi:peptide chain release factor 2
LEVMEQLKKQIDTVSQDITEAYARLNITKHQEELNRLREHMERPDFWQDNQKAQQISKDEAALSKKIQPWADLNKSAEELKELAALGDTPMQEEIKQQLEDLKKEFEELKKELRFQGPYDDHDVILSIYAGAGGTDAQDWAEMLLRMYVRWAESQKLDVKTIDQSPGEEAGIKSATIEITGGNYLYGKLAGEHGVQSVNTTDSAVRVTHGPTGITVAIQNERSQLQNKETALTIVRSRLAQLQMEQHAETIADVKGPNQSAEFGNQIRSYVLHPYKQVKDNRTGYESSDVEKILDGNLDAPINAWLDNK